MNVKTLVTIYFIIAWLVFGIFQFSNFKLSLIIHGKELKDRTIAYLLLNLTVSILWPASLIILCYYTIKLNRRKNK